MPTRANGSSRRRNTRALQLAIATAFSCCACCAVSSPPADGDSLLLVTTLDGVVTALSLSTGAQVWSVDTGGGLLRAYGGLLSRGDGAGAGAGAGAAPPVLIPARDGGLLVRTAGGALLALPHSVRDLARAPPLTAAGAVLVGSVRSAVLAVDAATGELVGDGGGGAARRRVGAGAGADADAGAGAGAGADEAGTTAAGAAGGASGAAAGSRGRLLWLGRTEYVVRAYDAAVGREVWNVSVAVTGGPRSGAGARAAAGADGDGGDAIVGGDSFVVGGLRLPSGGAVGAWAGGSASGGGGADGCAGGAAGGAECPPGPPEPPAAFPLTFTTTPRGDVIARARSGGARVWATAPGTFAAPVAALHVAAAAAGGELEQLPLPFLEARAPERACGAGGGGPAGGRPEDVFIDALPDGTLFATRACGGADGGGGGGDGGEEGALLGGAGGDAGGDGEPRLLPAPGGGGGGDGGHEWLVGPHVATLVPPAPVSAAALARVAGGGGRDGGGARIGELPAPEPPAPRVVAAGSGASGSGAAVDAGGGGGVGGGPLAPAINATDGDGLPALALQWLAAGARAVAAELASRPPARGPPGASASLLPMPARGGGEGAAIELPASALGVAAAARELARATAREPLLAAFAMVAVATVATIASYLAAPRGRAGAAARARLARARDSGASSLSDGGGGGDDVDDVDGRVSGSAAGSADSTAARASTASTSPSSSSDLVVAAPTPSPSTPAPRVVLRGGVPHRVVGRLAVSPVVLGTGSCGTVVFAGEYDGRRVAVKRLVRTFWPSTEREVSLLVAADGHASVVRYYAAEAEDDFAYLALEECEGSLADGLAAAARAAGAPPPAAPVRAPPPAARAFMRAIVEGVAHLHALGVAHRDIKPHNILLARVAPPSGDAAAAAAAPPPGADRWGPLARGAALFDAYAPKITDFGLSKRAGGGGGGGESVSSFPAGDAAAAAADAPSRAFGLALARRAEAAAAAGARASLSAPAPGSAGWTAPEVAARALGGAGGAASGDGGGADADADAPPPAGASAPDDRASPPPPRPLSARAAAEAADVWSLGAVLYAILDPAGGLGHPFGPPAGREERVLASLAGGAAGRPPPLPRLADAAPDAAELLSRMLHPSPAARPTAAAVAESPALWSDAARLDFLCRVSDRLEEERDEAAPLRRAIDAAGRALGLGAPAGDAGGAGGGDWASRLHAGLVADPAAHRPGARVYDYTSLADLLRLVRNRRHHYRALGVTVRRAVLGSDEDATALVPYLAAPGRFPALLPAVYAAALASLAHEPAWQEWLGPIAAAAAAPAARAAAAALVAARKAASVARATERRAAATGTGAGLSSGAGMSAGTGDAAAATPVAPPTPRAPPAPLFVSRAAPAAPPPTPAAPVAVPLPPPARPVAAPPGAARAPHPPLPASPPLAPPTPAAGGADGGGSVRRGDPSGGGSGSSEGVVGVVVPDATALPPGLSSAAPPAAAPGGSPARRCRGWFSTGAPECVPGGGGAGGAWAEQAAGVFRRCVRESGGPDVAATEEAGEPRAPPGAPVRVVRVVAAHARVGETAFRGGAHTHHPRYKSAECLEWAAARGAACPRGVRCDFAHSPVELRAGTARWETGALAPLGGAGGARGGGAGARGGGGGGGGGPAGEGAGGARERTAPQPPPAAATLGSPRATPGGPRGSGRGGPPDVGPGSGRGWERPTSMSFA